MHCVYIAQIAASPDKVRTQRYHTRVVLQVVFILSTNYAGSHLLAQLLGAHPLCRSVGELHNFEKFRARPDGQRNVGNDYASNAAFAGLGEVREDRWHRTIFDNVRALEPRISTLIDNSKKPWWAEKFKTNESFRSTYVHLVRDPRALVRRWLRSYTTARTRRQQRIRLARARPRLLGTSLCGDDVDVYLHKWLVANEEITRFIDRAGQSANLITYHDLVVNTSSSLAALMKVLGLTFDEQQLRYGRAQQMGTYKRDYAALLERSRIELDIRWREELSSEQQRRIETNDAIRAYLARCGLRMTNIGLTRESSRP